MNRKWAMNFAVLFAPLSSRLHPTDSELRLSDFKTTTGKTFLSVQNTKWGGINICVNIFFFFFVQQKEKLKSAPYNFLFTARAVLQSSRRCKSNSSVRIMEKRTHNTTALQKKSERKERDESVLEWEPRLTAALEASRCTRTLASGLRWRWSPPNVQPNKERHNRWDFWTSTGWMIGQTGTKRDNLRQLHADGLEPFRKQKWRFSTLDDCEENCQVNIHDSKANEINKDVYSHACMYGYITYIQSYRHM